MNPNMPNLLSERKISNSSMISTSLNGPIIRQRNSIRNNNDISSNITKKEWVYGNQNNNNNNNKEKYDLSLSNELNKLNEIYYNKKIELSETEKEYKLLNNNYYKSCNNLESKKEKLESLKQKNLNLKLMIMNIIKIKDQNQNK